MTAPHQRVRVLAIADADSYLKWAATLLDAVPADWAKSVVVIRSPIAPSADQTRDAVAGTHVASDVQMLRLPDLLRHVDELQPDVVLAACTGPTVDVVLRRIAERQFPRPVFISGLPGIAFPATDKALLFRSLADLYVTHSRREALEHAELAARLGSGSRITLTRLPFLPPAQVPTDVAARRHIVFASQAKVPAKRVQREAILVALANLATSRPDLTIEVKLRAQFAEQQTHRERHHYELLHELLVENGVIRPGLVHFSTGPMTEALDRAAGFLTVSSTAALEAFAAGVPTTILSDFGVNETMINLVFAESGCLGTLDDVRAGTFRRPDADWLGANYLHPPETDTLVADIEHLLAARAVGQLPAPRPLLSGPAETRRRWRATGRLVLPANVVAYSRKAGRRWRKVRRAARYVVRR